MIKPPVLSGIEFLREVLRLGFNLDRDGLEIAYAAYILANEVQEEVNG